MITSVQQIYDIAIKANEAKAAERASIELEVAAHAMAHEFPNICKHIEMAARDGQFSIDYTISNLERSDHLYIVYANTLRAAFERLGFDSKFEESATLDRRGPRWNSGKFELQISWANPDQSKQEFNHTT